MDNLISREDAVEVIYKALRTPTPDYRKEPFRSSMDLAVSLAKSIPSAQPEIILCKDCQWYTVNELKQDGTEDRRYKPSYCLLHGMHRDADWFCADGEKRTDE